MVRMVPPLRAALWQMGLCFPCPPVGGAAAALRSPLAAPPSLSPSPSPQAVAVRSMASLRQPPRRRPPRIRGAGAVPGPHPTGGAPSADAVSPSAAAVEAIRCPPRARGVGAARPRRWKVVRGDTVEVIGGRWAGARGRVVHVVRRAAGVVVEGVAVTPHAVRDADGVEQTLETEGLIHVSDVAVVCPSTGRPTRVGTAWLEDGTKVRVAKRSGAVIPRPAVGRRVPRRGGPDGPKDTSPEVAVARTYEDEEGLYGAYEDFLKLCEEGVRWDNTRVPGGVTVARGGKGGGETPPGEGEGAPRAETAA